MKTNVRKPKIARKTSQIISFSKHTPTKGKETLLRKAQNSKLNVSNSKFQTRQILHTKLNIPIYNFQLTYTCDRLKEPRSEKYKLVN